jgi:hypothetical protein
LMIWAGVAFFRIAISFSLLVGSEPNLQDL